VTISLQDVLTVGGATAIVLILIQVAKAALKNFDWSRFGALTAIVLGIVVVGLANASAIAEVRLGWGEAVLTGLLAGAAATGLYETGKGVASPST
jgi:hypothetical protein